MKIEKLRIRNKGRGWYVSASNYKNKKDMAYINLFFPSGCEEPEYHPYAESEYVFMDINCDAKFTSYEGKIGMTIFSYEKIDYSEDSKKAVNDVEISAEELPFY